MAGRPPETPVREGSPLSDRPEGAILIVHATPRASVNEVGPIEGDACRVRVTSAAVDGAANDAIVKLLAGATRVPKGRIRIVAGQCARRKRVLFEGVPAADVRMRLTRALR
jgi:uncharacterized protein YggU (UPF0235/DUF167 family)